MVSAPEMFKFGEDRLTASTAIAISNGQTTVSLSNDTREKVKESWEIVHNIVEKGHPVYGINTGFGPLCTTLISEEDTTTLQSNILQSHSVGLGDPISTDIAKLMMILKMHSLSFGYSGIRLESLERIQWHIENNIISVVPSQGSVGASGDLAPLAHLFLPLIGMGYVWQKDKQVPSSKILKKHKLKPLELGPKEGLALINGTQFIASFGIKVVEELQNCLDHADIIAAMNLEAMLGSSQP
ncbi:MAG: aromatic amino acid lyase, partial [Candidatus Heimdallarchaeota archaeon]|nr:aromatic amino acid lyase [Candidatus Heimdallarchaeota archaeon]